MDISTYSFNIFDEESSKEKIVIRDELSESFRDEFRIDVSLDEGEREKFNLSLNNFLNLIFQNIFSLNHKKEIMSRADLYEKVFFDILELIVVKKINFDSDILRFRYYLYNRINILIIISLQFEENQNFFAYNFIQTIELTIYYNSDKIECEIKNIDIQYKIQEDQNMKLNHNKNCEILISKKGIRKIFKEINTRNHLNYFNKLKYVSFIKKGRINEFHNVIREILIAKGLETSENKLYSNGLFRVIKVNDTFSNKLIKCRTCHAEHYEAIKIFFTEGYHRCKFFLCMNCFSIKRNLRIVNDDCLNCEDYLVNYLLMKNI